MIGRLNHVAIAVEDLEVAAAFYRGTLGATVSGHIAMPDHGVSVVVVELPNTRIELIEPLGDQSPIASFLAKHPRGGMHHICFEVENILAACEQLIATGTHILGDGIPKIGSHGKEVLFLNPKDCAGTLIELQQR